MSNPPNESIPPEDQPESFFRTLSGEWISSDQDDVDETGQKKKQYLPASHRPARIGPYTIIKKIGEGGMGSVFLAEQTVPIRRQVALKIIKAERDSSQIIVRFEAERQAVAMMDHPNIARVLDAGTDDNGAPYFAMELVKGVPFSAYCDQHKLSVRARLQLFIPICDAIQHAHQKGIIHRDLKPSNVLVAEYDGRPVPKVIDFGLAKALQRDSKLTDKTMFTEFGAIVGTLYYMSPEQAGLENKQIDARTDIYSLGVMLYELLTGSTPLDSETIQEHALLRILEIIREQDPPKPSARLSKSGDSIAGVSLSREIEPSRLKAMLSGELDWVVMKAIEKDRDRRYESASDFAKDIARFLNDQAVTARPPSITYRAQKFFKRNRTQVIAGTTLVAMILIAASLGLAVFKGRESAAMVKLQSQFSDQVVQLDLSETTWTQAQATIAALGQRDPSSRPMLTQQFADAALDVIDTRLKQPRLLPNDREAIDAAINRLGTFSVTPIQQQRLDKLALTLSELNGGWTIEFIATSDDSASFAKLLAAADCSFDKQTDSATFRKPMPPTSSLINPRQQDYFAPISTVTPSTSGNLRVEAEFESWEIGHEVGLSLNIVDDLGYDFVVRTPVIDIEPETFDTRDITARNWSFNHVTFAQAVKSDTAIVIEIRRGQSSLLRVPIDRDLVIGERLRIFATRVGTELTIQVNDFKPYRVIDPFPFRQIDAGHVGVRAIADTRMTMLRCDTQQIKDGLAPLQQGDQLFAADNHFDALDEYTKQSADPTATKAIVDEAKFKMATCLIKLQRETEAQPILTGLLRSDSAPWSTLAGITLWDQTLKSGRASEADELFAFLQSTDKFGEAAFLTSEETRSRILGSIMEQFTSITTLLRENPNRLAQLNRASEVDRVLSYDGQGTIEAQLELSKAYRFEGQFDEALEIVSRLTNRTISPRVLTSYTRLLRLSGQAGGAIGFINESLANPRTHKGWLYRDRACAYAALDRFDEAERDIDRSFDAIANTTIDDNWLRVNLYLMRGFLQHRRGDELGAKQTWRDGFFASRGGFLGKMTGQEPIFNHLLILGSLSGELDRQDVTAFLDRTLTSFGGGFSSMAASMTSQDSIFRSLDEMWRTPRGMQLAESFAYANLTLRERIMQPVILAAHQFFLHGAFPNHPSDADQQLTWDLVSQIADLFLVKRELSMEQVAWLMTTWKLGTTGFLGWGGVRGSLDEAFRGPMAYVLGQRLAKQGNLDGARELLNESANLEQSKPATRELAHNAVRLLGEGLGAVEIKSMSAEPISIAFTKSNSKSVKTISVETAATVELEPGEYELTAESNAATLLPGKVKVSLGQSSAVVVKSTWSPAASGTAMSGLLTHPAVREKGTQWQLNRTLLEGFTHDHSWHPNGESIAMVGDDVVRIFDATSRELQAMYSYDGHQMTSVDWSPDGKLLAIGDVSGKVRFVDPETGESYLESQPAMLPIRHLRWNLDGSALAICDDSDSLRIIAVEGTPIAKFKGTLGWGRQLAWSPSGKFIAVACSKGAMVWDVTSGDVMHAIDHGMKIWGILWSEDEKRLVVTTGTEFLMHEVANGDILNRVATPIQGEPRGVTWDRDNKTIIANGYSREFVFWDTTSKQPDAVQVQQQYGVAQMRWNPQGTILAVGNANGVCFYSNEMQMRPAIGIFPQVSLASASIDPRSKTLAVVTEDKHRLRLLDLASGATTYTQSTLLFQCATWHPDQDILAAGTTTGELWLGDTKLNELKVVDVGSESITDLIWSHDNKHLFWTTSIGAVCQSIFDPESKTFGDVLKLAEFNPMTWSRQQSQQIALSNDGVLIALAIEKQVKMLSAVDGSLIRTVDFPNMVRCVAFSLDSQRLFVCGEGRVATWDMAHDWETKEFAVYGALNCILETKPGIVVIGTESGAVLSLNMDNGIVSVIRPGAGRVKGLQLTPAGTLLVWDQFGTIQEIDLDTGRVESLVLATQNDDLACFSSGGKRLSSIESIRGLSVQLKDSAGRRHQSADTFYSDAGMAP